MKEQREQPLATVTYQQHLRAAAVSLEKQAQMLRIAADLVDVQEEPDVDIAVQTASLALGSINSSREDLLDHTLSLAVDAPISQRALARNLGMSQPAMVRRTQKVLAQQTRPGEDDR